jgi:uncharacterized protein involved in exopolysaccharide biosynthesis
MALTRLNSTRDFFRVWFFWKRQALIIFISTIFIVMAFSYLYTPDYESTAKILILPRTSEGVVISTGSDETRIAQVSIEDINTEIELLISDDVLRATVKSFMENSSGQGIGLKIRGQSWIDAILDKVKQTIGKLLIFLRLREQVSFFESNVDALRRAIEVEPVAMSAVILVTLTAESPKVAEAVLNRLLDVYILHHNEVLSKDEGFQFFDEQSSEFRKNLYAYEQKFQDFQKKWNIVDLSRQNDLNIEILADLRKELKMTEISYDESRSRIEMLRSALSKNGDDILINKEMRTIPSIVELENSIVPLLIKRSEIGKTFTRNSREYREIDNQIKTIRGEISKEVQKAINTDELELKALGVKKASLQDKIMQMTQESIALNQKEKELRNLQREIEFYKENYMLYSSKTEEARIASERKKRNLANVSIASKASLPAKASFPNRLLMLIISTFVSLCAAAGSPFLLEFLDHRIKIQDDVEKLAGLPVICSFQETKS